MGSVNHLTLPGVGEQKQPKSKLQLHTSKILAEVAEAIKSRGD